MSGTEFGALGLGESVRRRAVHAVPVRRRLLAYLAVAALPFVLTGCSGTAAPAATSSPSAARTFTASGTVDVPLDLSDAMKASGGPAQGQPCQVKPSYKDVTSEKVEIKDASGSTVALGQLEAGTLQPQKDNSMVLFARCRLPFTIPDVPEGKFFSVHVGDPTREAKQFSRAELVAGVSVELADKAETNN